MPGTHPCLAKIIGMRRSELFGRLRFRVRLNYLGGSKENVPAPLQNITNPTDWRKTAFLFVSRLLILYFLNLHLFRVDVLSLKILDPAPSKMVCQLKFRNLFEVPSMGAEIDLGKLNNRKRLKKGVIKVLVCLLGLKGALTAWLFCAHMKVHGGQK